MSFGQSEVASWQRLTVSGVVGDSGKAIDVVGYTIKSGSTAAVVSFLNGTSTAAPLAWADQARATSAEQSITLAYPTRTSSGLFVSFDANTSAVSVFYRQVMGA